MNTVFVFWLCVSSFRITSWSLLASWPFPLLLFLLLFAYVSHHIMLSRWCNLTTLPLPFLLSFASLDTHGNGIAESSWLTDDYTTSFAMIMTRERCLPVLEFFFCFFFDQGIGSRSAAWASRVDVGWVSVCVSYVVGCWSLVWCFCIPGVFVPYVCIPNYYLMVWCNDIHLAKASSRCASILGGTFEFL